MDAAAADTILIVTAVAADTMVNVAAVAADTMVIVAAEVPPHHCACCSEPPVGDTCGATCEAG